jgi:exosortase/archaeosortase family protein
MIGTLVAAEIRMDLWKKCLMVLLILPIVLVANTFRILVTILTATLFGDAAAEGLFHWASGIMLFGISLALLFSVRNLLATGRAPRAAPSTTPESVKDKAIPPADWPPPADDLW